MKVDGSIEKFYQYSFPMQTVLVTCNDEHGKTNIITIAWHTTISKKPPLYGISLAPGRYSHDFIKKSKEFVVNFVYYNMVEKAHFCGTHSGRSTDKIDKTRLTLSPAKKVKVPLIKECYAHLECRMIQNLTVGDHTLFIGEVVAVQADENTFKNDLLITNKIQPLYYIGGNKYTTTDRSIRKEF
ncbi:MAG: flavin reductase family protein [Thermoplasmatales archaeon]|nr:MAG: flavin reductase family protein [Thermoplasmatales archaeon]